MIWVFDRNGQRLHYEIRRSEADDQYELVVTHPDGRIETEQTRDPADLLRRCSKLAEALLGEGWRMD